MRPLLLALSVTLSFAACNNSESSTAPSEKDSVQSTKFEGITETDYGTVDGNAVKEYTIANKSGMQVSITNYGATVTKIFTADRNGKIGDVILGYDSLSGFRQKGNPYFGAIVGRYANRIANAKFSLDGKTYTLAGNDNGNSLHGGLKGFDKVVWNAEKLPGDTSIRFTYNSPDGEEGYPGNLVATVTYTVTADNSLKLEYSATTDKATPVNITSHCYFNLSAGADSTILHHQLVLNADRFTPVSDKLIPTGVIAAVKGTPMDFTTSKSIGRDIDQVIGGYDHNWILNKNDNSLSLAATLFDSTSGREMKVFTTEPAIQFYSGNFLDGTLSNTIGGAKYVKHAALCLEAQHYPDSPNQPSFPNTILKPGDTYRQTTVYHFSTR